jgi:hypothetical protein
MKGLSATVACCVLLTSVSWAGAEPVKPLRSWKGHVVPKSKGPDATVPQPPAEATVKEAANWAKLLPTLRLAEKDHTVDFTKGMVLVVTVPGDNSIGVTNIEVGSNDVVTYQLTATKNAGDGFSYLLLVLPRPAAADPLDGKVFRSVEKLTGGDRRDGTVNLIHWEVRFKGGSFTWLHTDVLSPGTYQFDAKTGAVVIKGSNLQASFDAKTGVLTWDGRKYEAARGEK